MKTLKNLVETNPQSKNISENGNKIINSNLKIEIKNILNKIKIEIKQDFKDIYFNKNDELKNILKYMFENESKGIINEDFVFLRTLEIEIDKIIDDEKDFDKNILFNNNNNNIMPHTELLENINHCENLIRNKILKFQNYNIMHFPRVEFTIKSEVMKLKKLSVLTIYSLICKYEK